MNQQDLITTLQTIPWYQEISPEHFEKLAGISSMIEVEAKHELFREGDPEDYDLTVDLGIRDRLGKHASQNGVALVLRRIRSR